ncbi:MAG: ribonuclease R family protein [Opitutales bacterium]
MKNVEELLHAHLMSPDYVPARIEELAEQLELKTKRELGQLQKIVHKRIQEGSLARVKKERLCLPKDADLVGGTIMFRQSGSAVIIVETPGKKDPETFEVRAEDTYVAMHKDRVLARKVSQHRGRYRNNRAKRGLPSEDRTYVKVIQILDRANPQIVGTLKRSSYSWFVIPDDPRLVQDVLVPEPSKTRLKPKPKIDDKVVVKVIEWKQRHLNPEGTIIDVLGKSHHPMAEYKGILVKHGLEPDFPPKVMDEVKGLPNRVRKSDIQGRMDCRNLYTITIDPEDAKDFDDAVTLEEQPDGSRRVGIHIADVAAYVKPGTALSREAKKRGNSTYLVGTVIPMLPHALSNGVCSLVEAKDRLTKSVFLTFDKKNTIIKTEFANTVIHSRKRLTYEQAHAFLNTDDIEKIREIPLPAAHQTGFTGRALNSMTDDELGFLRDLVRNFWDIASSLRSRRMKKGSLDLDMTEVKIFVDAEGYADRMETVEHNESHQLIEEFMLAANEAVAKAIDGAQLPCLYRVHDAPDGEKLAELEETMASFGIATGDLSNRKHIVSLLKKLKTHPQGYTLKIHVLRSLRQACYRASSDGHYGLCKDDYTHFTSPIRRYADLVVHQTFDRLLKRMKMPTAPAKLDARYSAAQLVGVGEHISITERNSQEAERDSVKIKLLEYFDRQVGLEDKKPMEAVITDVKNHGMFIEITSCMAFGMIRLSSLKDDLYILSNDGQSLTGRRKHRTFSIGDKVQVVVETVDRFKRQMNFTLSDEEFKRPNRPTQTTSSQTGERIFKPKALVEASKKRESRSFKRSTGKPRDSRKDATKPPKKTSKRNQNRKNSARPKSKRRRK